MIVIQPGARTLLARPELVIGSAPPTPSAVPGRERFRPARLAHVPRLWDPDIRRRLSDDDRHLVDRPDGRRNRGHEHHAGVRYRATREIGIRKAVGARRRDILLQFLMRGSVLTAIGGVAACCSDLARDAGGQPRELPPLHTSMFVRVGVGFASLVGIAFGIFPANRRRGRIRSRRCVTSDGARPHVGWQSLHSGRAAHRARVPHATRRSTVASFAAVQLGEQRKDAAHLPRRRSRGRGELHRGRPGGGYDSRAARPPAARPGSRVPGRARPRALPLPLWWSLGIDRQVAGRGIARPQSRL